MKKLLLVTGMAISNIAIAADLPNVPLKADVKKIDEIVTTAKLDKHRLVEVNNQTSYYKTVTFVPNESYIKSEEFVPNGRGKTVSFDTAIRYSKYVHPSDSSQSRYGIEYISIKCLTRDTTKTSLSFNLAGEYVKSSMFSQDLHPDVEHYRNVCNK
ncbi:hypothetical protein [Acinetobacter indicus]|uniref:Uncharacterized protein n=1 Tax=Acinetobacter indicus TaxID=756892 RepID=A0AAW8Z2A0_9GAMM|nr:hypothetical protein [Acinetobacter indicus]MDV4317059.1 hypothetical protein [Acinetobacter indicus]